MNTKNATIGGLCVLAAAVLLYIFTRPQPSPPLTNPPVAEPTQVSPTDVPEVEEPLPPLIAEDQPAPARPRTPPPAPTATDPAQITMMPIAQTAEELHNPNMDPQEDLHIIEGLLEFYRRVYQENPVAGVNEEVVDALTGGNDKGIGLIPKDHPAINEKGQLVDRWGTPYVFHAASGTHMQLLSAGPDKKVGTPDDLAID